MEEALRAKLLATSAVAVLVADRVTWKLRKRGAPLPAIVLHLITRRPDVTRDGPSGLSWSRVQADCLGTTHYEALTVRRAVEAALNGLVEPPFQVVTVIAERDDSDAAQDGGDPIHRNSLDLSVWHAA